MPQTDPTHLAILLTMLGLLMSLSVVMSRASARTGIPVTLAFLGVGVAARWMGLGGGDDMTGYRLAYQVGTVALALILFDGGLNTALATIRPVLAPATVLATVGVVGTAALVAVVAHLIGLPWDLAWLVGAVVSSTDASAVFSVLRGSRLHLTRRVGATLELESGLNDPMAVILTVLLTVSLRTDTPVEPLAVVVAVVRDLGLGLLGGLMVGLAGRKLLRSIHVLASGLYPVLTLAIAFVAFGLPAAVGGSGFLAVYVAGILIGQGTIPHRANLLRVHDATAWLAQVGMFLVLGLLVQPADLVTVAPEGIVIGLATALVARPVVVWVCLRAFRYPLRETAYIGWVGLRGAVPIILAMVPVLAGIPGARHLFHLVFFVVVVNAIVPGATVRHITRWLRIGTDEPDQAPAVLEIHAARPLAGTVLTFQVTPDVAVAEAKVGALPLSAGASVMLVMRGAELLPGHPRTKLLPGDHVSIFTHAEDEPLVRLLFGAPESD